MNAVPPVSIIVTTSRQPADVLAECLESIIAQTRPDWETIVVDDGSADGIAEGVVMRLTEPRIHLVGHDVNRGLGAARNTGIRRGRAQLVVPVDADDRLSPRFVEDMSRALKDCPDAAWAVADWQCFGGSADVWVFPTPPFTACPEHAVIPGAGTMMYRRVWEAVGGYLENRESMGAEDWDFWLGALERGLRGIHVPAPLYLHRRHRGSMSATTSVYNDHANREALYRRHKSTFDSFDGDCERCPPSHRVASFRSQGAITSSVASLEIGERRRAIGLAARAVILRPDGPSVRQFARSVLPKALVSPLRFFKLRTRRSVPGRDHIGESFR